MARDNRRLSIDLATTDADKVIEVSVSYWPDARRRGYWLNATLAELSGSSDPRVTWRTYKHLIGGPGAELLEDVQRFNWRTFEATAAGAFGEARSGSGFVGEHVRRVAAHCGVELAVLATA